MSVSVDTQFSQLMTDMVSLSAAIATYIQSTGAQRLWMIPTKVGGGWTFDPTDIPNLGSPFLRDNVNTQYANEFSGAGENKIKVAMGTGVEIGYMGMMERAFRERHRTPTRALQLLGARRAAHGGAGNVHKSSVEAWVQELLTT